ncbi:hypothetical protein [Niabella aquatica]
MKKNILFLALIFMILLSACEKDKPRKPKEPDPVEQKPDPGVYLSGAQVWAYNDILALHVKDAEAKALTNRSNIADNYKLAFLEKDIYSVGFESTGSLNEFNQKRLVAKYWKNQTAVELTNGSKNARAYDIFMHNKSVYIAGYEDNKATGATERMSCFWKDGQQHFIPRGDYPTSVQCIYVNNGDVYMGGYEEIRINQAPYLKDRPTYWKNDTKVSLPYGTADYAYVMDILVDGNDVYAVGYGNIYSATEASKSVALFWKNGTVMPLDIAPTGNANARAIIKSGNDIYICGFEESGNKPVYWKNQTKVPLKVPEGTTAVQPVAIYVAGNNVYVCGTSSKGGIYWKNGEPTLYPLLSRINDILVIN